MVRARVTLVGKANALGCGQARSGRDLQQERPVSTWAECSSVGIRASVPCGTNRTWPGLVGKGQFSGLFRCSQKHTESRLSIFQTVNLRDAFS